MQLDPNELAAVIKESGLSFRETTRSFIFYCPRCQKKDKLYILKKDGRFVCWYCRETDNFKGKAEYALTELTHIPVRELRRRLYGLDLPQGHVFGINLREWLDDDESISVETPKLLLPVEMPPDYYPIDHRHSARGRAYLESRGISLELAQAYRLRYCPPDRRVVFPVESEGQLIGWQARTIDPETSWWCEELGETLEMPKILSSLSLGEKRERSLMFSDRLNGSAHAVLAEGPVDAMKAHLCGGNVAAMGKAISPQQIQLIRNAGIERLYLALDPDAGHDTAKLVKDVSKDLECYQVLPPLGRKDLGECTCEEVYEAFKNARRLTTMIPGTALLRFDGDAILRRWRKLNAG